MDTPTWTAEHPLVRLANRAPWAFEFFQLLHLIERMESQRAAIGRAGPAADEPVRLRPALSLGFPAGDLAAAEWVDDADPGRIDGKLLISTTFMGLYGSDSPLPTHMTEALIPETDDDLRVRAFLDLFHHRIYSLLYRVWTKYRYYVTFREDCSDPISQIVRGFLGIGTAGLVKQLTVPQVRLFRYVGLMVQRPRSGSGLVGILSDYFPDVNFDLDQCVGRWLPIQPNDLNRLGGRKCSLGQDFLLGESVFDRSGKFRVKIGPVGFESFTNFLPPGKGAADLGSVVRFFCGDPLQYDVQVTLHGDEVPETPLGERGFYGRLAWTSWLKSKPCGDQSVVFSVPDTKAAGERRNAG